MKLFHYTDLNALISILQRQEIWLTDIRYLNDERELHEGLEKIRDILKSIRSENLMDQDYSSKAISFLDNVLREHTEFIYVDDSIFVFSLSNQPDSLSQWRAYGKYAIEFDVQELSTQIGDIQKCSYKNSLHEKNLLEKITSAISGTAEDMTTNDGCVHKGMDIASQLISLAATIKHSGFEDERESRIILSTGEYGCERKINYRTRGDVLIPYISLPISLDCIKSVTVGPLREQDMAFNSLYEFIKRIEYSYQSETGNLEFEIDVLKSQIPFRG
ncbi:DUF2971 domain-containing protein [Aeromonas sp. R2-4]|uniref:DUF2971 domain-containing protein n=1 Tax=Aeromonas sp. R2-4 TaxID=3138462 RepID=UPI0034A10C3C